VRESADYQAIVEPDLSIDATLRLTYHVNPSPRNLEGYGPYFGRWGSKHDYQDFVRIYVPRGSRVVSMKGIDWWAPQQAYGMTQLAGRILVRAGHTLNVTMGYRIPANALAGLGGHRYRLSIRRQPGANLSGVRVRIRGGSGVSILDAGRMRGAVDRVLRLDHDVTTELPLSGNIEPRPVELPDPVYRDPYLPYSALRDPRHPL
jgi:hypothetical protein